MSSSKIIKACSGPEYRCFDFLEINGAACKRGPNDGSQHKAKADQQVALPDNGEQALERLQEELQDRILEADRQAREVEKAAYAKGFEQGRRAGELQAMDASRAMVQRLEGLFEELDGLRTRVFQDYRNWLISSSLEIARYVIQRELQAQPDLLLQTMESALDQATDQHPLTFILNPDDLELLREQVDLSCLEHSNQSITLKGDEGISRGGCLLESAVQLIDGSLEARLQLVEDEIKREKGSDESVSPEK